MQRRSNSFSSSPPSLSSPPTLSTFKLFSYLPTELRLKIFEHATYSFPARLIELRTSCHPLGISYQPLDHANGNLEGEFVNVSDIAWECHTHNPPLLAVSRESRAVGRRERWRTRFEVDFVGARGQGKEQGGQAVYIDPSSDVVHANLKWVELFRVLVNDLRVFGIENHGQYAGSACCETGGKGTWNLALNDGFIARFYPTLSRSDMGLTLEKLGKAVVVAEGAGDREAYREEWGSGEAQLIDIGEELGEDSRRVGVEQCLEQIRPAKWEMKAI